MRLHGPFGESWRKLRSSRGLRVKASAESSDVSAVHIEERDRRFRDIFHALVQDIIHALHATGDETASLGTVLFQHLENGDSRIRVNLGGASVAWMAR